MSGCQLEFLVTTSVYQRLQQSTAGNTAIKYRLGFYYAQHGASTERTKISKRWFLFSRSLQPGGRQAINLKKNGIFEFRYFLLLYFLRQADSSLRKRGEQHMKTSLVPSHVVTHETHSPCSVDFSCIIIPRVVSSFTGQRASIILN